MMRYVGTTHLSKAKALEALDWMPRERGSDFLAGPIAGGAINRTYTRVMGDRFQVSRTAGMGSGVVCSGKVVEHHGDARIYLTVGFGYAIINPVLLGLGFALVSLSLLRLPHRVPEAAAIGAAGLAALIWYIFRRWEARWLMSVISDALEGVTWMPDRS